MRAPATELGMQVMQHIAANHFLGQRAGLNQVEPMVVGPCKVHVGSLVHVECGCNVEHTQLQHAQRKIKRKAVRNTPTPVVATQKEIVHIELVKQAHHILRHGTFAVVAVVSQAWRMGRVTIAAQIGQNQSIVIFEGLRHAVPHDMRLRKAMQQDQYGLVHLIQPIGRKARANHHTVHVELSFFKTLKPCAGWA